jgi:phage shock protein PspC (stress-responsive transcriptional regulator)
MNRRLYRSTTDTVLGGVAAGVSEYLDVDPSIVRIVWAVLGLVTGGIFVVLYVVMWIVVPEVPRPLPRAEAGTLENATTAGEGTAAEASAGSGYASAVAEPHARRRGSGNGALIVGLVLIGVGVWFLVRQYIDIDIDRLWPVGLVLLGALLLFVSLRRSPTP